MRATQRAHEVVAEVLRPGELAVDATAGNGHDTRFLAERVGPGGRVVAFDIQREAIESARARLAAAGLGGRVVFRQESHGRLKERLAGERAGAVMFNLGYLPGGDAAVMTETGETLRAIEAARALVREGGVVTVVCYPGHAGGDVEAAAVAALAERTGGEVFPAMKERAPFLVVWRGEAEAVTVSIGGDGD